MQALQTLFVLRREFLVAGLITLAAPSLHAQSALALDAAILPLATQEAPLVLETLKQLTRFDSGTGQAEGMSGVASTIEAMAKELGGVTERIHPLTASSAPISESASKAQARKNSC